MMTSRLSRILYWSFSHYVWQMHGYMLIYSSDGIAEVGHRGIDFEYDRELTIVFKAQVSR